MINPDRPPSGFYVYLLVDPRDQKPFYAGKGQGWRAWQHEKDVKSSRAGANHRKVQRIQDIVDAQLSVIIAIVAVFDLESAALDHEFKVIDASPSLLNQMPGGQGQGLSAREAGRRFRARALRLQRLRDRERRNAALQEAQSRRALLMSKARTEAERAEIEAWLNGLSGPLAERMIAPQLQRIRAEDEKRMLSNGHDGMRKKGRREARQFGRRGFVAESMNPADYLITSL